MWWLRRSGAANKTLLLPLPGDWLSWLERCLHTAEVTGSNPVSPTPRLGNGFLNPPLRLTTKVVQADPAREFRERPRCSVLSYPVVSMAVVLGNVKKTIKDLPEGWPLN